MLNEPQRTAVLHPSGPLLLFAGAGSGKTRTLTYRIANLIAEHRVPPYRILAVTFTNKAASEMRARLVQIVGDDIARDLYIGTFHGMAAKFLRRYAEAARLSSSFTIYDDSDQKALVSRALKALDLDDRVYSVKAVLGRISAHKREGKDPLEEPLTAGLDDDLDALAREYQTLLGRADAVDFDDLLLKVLRLVEDPVSPAGRDLRRKFEHVLVDEFQDTNWVQYRIVRALSAESRNLCVVGDDDQSIYRWRGADVRIIRGFKHDFPEAEVIKLEQNYRSTANIVAAALAVIEKATIREPKELWTEAEKGDPVLIRGVSDERAEAAFIAGQIDKARRSGTSPKELAIFYRTHAQSRVLEESLRSLNLPYQIIGGMKFFERAEIKDMLAYLRVIHNPNSDTDLARIINVPTRGIGQKSIARLLEVANTERCSLFDALAVALADGSLGAATTKKLGSFHDLLTDFRKASESLKPSELVERILGDTGYRRALEEEDSAESDARLQNLAEFVGSLSEYESEAPLTGEEPNLAGYLERVALVAAVDSLTESPMVSMMTVHSAKGLEFDQVWLTGMEEETFPYKGFNEEDPEDMDEERRLAYVAITRARKHLTITYAASRFLFGRTKYLAPSRFLADLPDSAVRREGSPSRPHFATAGFGASAGFGSGASRPPFGSQGSGETLSHSRSRQAEIQVRPGERFIERDDGEGTLADGHDSQHLETITVRPGQRVRHARFGQGIVEGVESGGKPTVIVRFPGYGTRRIVAEFLDFG
jgi:DNA helicase II / ATP-dependent DNA helicase PcrA